MPWPRLGTFGINDNPVNFTPFVENNSPFDGGEESASDFLLMDGEFFLLMAGGNLLLMGT